MDTAVVKLNALANAVGPAAQHHNFFTIARLRFTLCVLGFVGGIHVGRVRAELGRAGIYPLIDRAHAQVDTALAHLRVTGVQLARQAAVGKTFLLEGAQGRRIQAVQHRALGRLGQALKLQFDLHNLLDLHQKPAVYTGEGKNFLDRHALGKGIAHVPDALGAGGAQFTLQHLAVLGFFVHAVHAHFQATQGLLKRLLEGATHGHHLAHGFHLGRQAAVGGREFLKCKAWNLGNHIVNTGLETGRRSAPGNVVTQFIQGIAHGQFSCYFGDRKPGGLGGQRRGARHARIHLNDHHAPVVRIDGELHI